MFSKGSRYRNLSASSPVSARGERQRSKDLRVIPQTIGRFQHTVREGDRLDLLAFKYYGEATKWWQISDANPEPPFPTDLLDQWPIVRERIVLTHPSFEDRFTRLLGGLQELLRGLGDSVQLVSLESLNEMNESQLDSLKAGLAVVYAQPDFLLSTILVKYPSSAATRSRIMEQLAVDEFHFLGAESWSEGTEAAETLTFDDLKVKSSWQLMLRSLVNTAGMLEVRSNVAETTLEVVYHGTALPRQRLFDQINNLGFAPTWESSAFSRTGAKITIPPNQVV
jgi:phage tail protein X